MKLAILSLLVGSAAAFAPVPTSRAFTSLKAEDDAGEAVAVATMDATQVAGVNAPLMFYDPLGYLGENPTAYDDVENFDNLRYIELKHGRCAMLATVGYIVCDLGARFPGAENVPNGFAALDQVPGMVWAQLTATVLAMEMANGGFSLDGKDAAGTQEFPGDFRNGYIDFGWDDRSDEWKMEKRTIEINNGRAAMMGILGIMVHEYLGNIDEILPWHKL